MTYLSDLHSYLHQSSLLTQAYPDTRITTKYSLPRKATSDTSASSKGKVASTTATTDDQGQPREKREPSATLILKTFHPDTGVCLKYRTDKAQEVSRLMTGLGRIAKGEIIEMPSVSANATAGAGAGAGADKMDIDEPESKTTSTPVPTTQQSQPPQPQAQPSNSGGGGGGGKKKGKKGKK